MAYLVGALRTYRLSEAELRETQAKRLRRVLGTAYSSIPFYRDTFRNAGVSLSDLADPKLSSLPLLTKREVVSSFSDLVCPRGGRVSSVRTGSGTSGQSVRFAVSDETLDLFSALIFRRFVNLGYRPWERVVTLWGPAKYWRRSPGSDGSERPTTNMYSYPVRAFGRPLPTIRVVALGSSPDEEARLFSRLDPAFVVSRPFRLRRLGVKMEQLGLRAKPRCVIVGSEATTPTCVREIESLFDTTVVRNYGSSEFGPLGSECLYKAGIHLGEDFAICEVLKDGEQVGPGETGELVLTSLFNELMPLIRFRTGDMVTLADGGKCSCGSYHVRVKEIQGREGDGLVTSSGRRVLPMAVADFLESELGLRDFQLEQRAPDRLVLKASEDQLESRETLRRLKEYLQGVLEGPVSLECMTRPPEDYWLKTRPIISGVSPTSAPVE